MQTLDAALVWARRGFKIFPLYENTKTPIIDDWPTQATTDENLIRSWWTDPVLKIERQHNIGCLCTDMVVVDIDVKEGKNGTEEYAAFGGSYDTLVVQTPTGGFHCYFHGPDSSNSSLSKSVDIRSHNGFVVAPGSQIEGVPYRVVVDRAMEFIPYSIESRLTPAYKKDLDLVVDYTKDTEASVAAGIGYLQSCPAAVEGANGDEQTFKVTARLVNEMGLSEATAFGLLRDYYNPRCIPPWDLEDLWDKVQNAVNYGTAMAGRLTPEITFAGVSVAPPPKIFGGGGIDFGNALEGQAIEPRPWLVERMLMRRNITLLLAAGSAGKSTISLALAAHLSQGLDFAGYKSRGACKTIVYNGEDDLPEQSRRLSAICSHHNLPYGEVKRDLMLLSPEQIKITLARREQYNRVREETIIDHLVKAASPSNVGLLVLDPLVKIHQMDESDNVDMDFVMETVTYVARKADVAVLALHHVSKTSTRQESRVGNMDVARGASAVVNAARIAFTLLGPSQTDLETYGFDEADANKWSRLDDAKMNLSLADNNTTWFKKGAVRIPSGDLVGVLHHEKVQKTQEHILDMVSKYMSATFIANNLSTIGGQEAIAIIRANVPLLANKKDKEIKDRLEGMFKFGHVYNGQTIRAVRDPQQKLLFTLS